MTEANINLAGLRTMNQVYRNQGTKSGKQGDTDAKPTFGSGITNIFYGNNFMGTPLAMPLDKMSHGYIFFTRPQLNMQTSNLKFDSFFYPLLTKNDVSIHRAIRTTLDPRLQWYENTNDMQGQPMYARCPLIDPCNPFIPMISNTCISASGFPDKAVPFYRTPDDNYKGNHSMADGTTDYNSAFSINITVRNIRGAPVYRLIDYWTESISRVVEGVLVKYSDYVLGGLIDYNTRIYRLILDQSKQYVEDVGCTGASAPASLPRAQRFDFNIENALQDLGQQMSFQFESNGFFHGEQALNDFNRIQEGFHPGMRGAGARQKYMKKIPRDLLPCFNCRAYPRINHITRELEWWTTIDYYNQIVALNDNILEALTTFAAGETNIQELGAMLRTTPNSPSQFI